MNIKNCFYSIEDIALWQSEISNKTYQKITLPSLQRGFVWKPHQMEALWDSILRGYPIGCILMSHDGTDIKFLLDGQQRCTTIALGFHNPFSKVEKEIFALRRNLPSIWIDLKPEKNFANNYHFAMRVLTKSHPWGYDQRNNKSALPMKDRREALAFYKAKNPTLVQYTNLSPSETCPWDASFPVPLAFVLNTNRENIEKFTNNIKDKMRSLSIRTKYSKDVDVNFDQLTSEDLQYIFDGIMRALQLTVPEITISSKVLMETDDDVAESQDPTLFIRLNSAGTDLSGEELIYSIFKAMYPLSKDLVENIGASYLAPKKIISIFSRLAACSISEYNTFPQEYNIKTFRLSLKNSDFKQKLQNYISLGESSKASSLIESAIWILSKGKSNSDIPPIIIKQWIVSNNELFLLLLIYLECYSLDLNNLETENIYDISSTYIHLLWFSKDKKIANKMFDILIKNKDKRIYPSWSEAVNSLINENPTYILPLLEPEKWRHLLLNLVVKQKINNKQYVNKLNNASAYHEIAKMITSEMYWNDETLIKDLWDDFLGRIFWNKTMLLYAQRDYINIKFSDYNQFENIEDTNRPWDWDHIYPISWVYNRTNIHPLVKAWVNSIGNFRALSYDDNRSESNHKSPHERLYDKEKKDTSFILENDNIFWNRIKDAKIQDGPELDNYLNAVVNRTVNIYKEWYDKYYMNM